MKNIFFPLAILISILFSCSSKEDKKVNLEKYKVEQINQITGVARIEPIGKISPLGAEIIGKIAKIHVVEGQIIKKGTLLLSMDQTLDEAQLAQIDSKINTKQQHVLGLEAKISATLLKIEIADKERQRDKNLANAQAGTQKAAFDSENNFENLKAELKIAKAELMEAKANLEEAIAEKKYTGTLLDKKNIYAPSDGMVLSWEIKPGEAVNIGSKLGDFAPDGDLIATTEVDELFAMKVKIGQKASINVQGTNQELSSGKVIYCAPYLSKKSIFNDRADNLEDRRVREVRVKIDNPKAVLIGSRVECIIKL